MKRKLIRRRAMGVAALMALSLGVGIGVWNQTAEAAQTRRFFGVTPPTALIAGTSVRVVVRNTSRATVQVTLGLVDAITGELLDGRPAELLAGRTGTAHEFNLSTNGDVVGFVQVLYRAGKVRPLVTASLQFGPGGDLLEYEMSGAGDAL